MYINLVLYMRCILCVCVVMASRN